MAIKRFLLGMAVGAIFANLYAGTARRRRLTGTEATMNGDDMLHLADDDLADAVYGSTADVPSRPFAGRTDDLLEPDTATSAPASRESSNAP